MSWPRQADLYASLDKKAIQSFLKTLGPLIIGYLIASSLRSGAKIGFSVYSIDIFASASFFLFLLSFAYLINAVAFNHLTTAMSAKLSISARIRIPGFSFSAYDVLHEGTENGLGLPNHLEQFHKNLLPIPSILEFLFSVLVVAILLPIGALGWFLVSEQCYLVLNGGLPLVERISAAFGILSVATAVLFIVFFHMPLPVRKNRKYIRWNFLYGLTPHPSDEQKFKRWLDEPD